MQFLKGVGPARRKLLANLGVATIEDLFYIFPRRYEDRTSITPIAKIKLGETQTVTGKVLARGGRRTWFTKKHVYETVIDDGSGRLCAVWFNQPYLEYYFKAGAEVVLFGKVEIYKNRLQMVAPEYEIIDRADDNLNIGRIVPIYPLTRGITQRYLRKIIYQGLERYQDDLKDILPVWLRNRHRLLNIKRSLQNIHFPESSALQEEAHRRISFEEFFIFQISVVKRRMSLVTKPGIEHKIDLDLVNQFTKMFPFSLTKAQQRVIHEIAGDMQKNVPMLRLLQGDVGSGKTLVALFGCVAAYQNGYQAAVMAPTEILARQHYESIQTLLRKGPFKGLKVDLLVSGNTPKKREEICGKLKSGEIHVLVGTHALLSEGVDFKNLSFVVIDEQHKFGVKQRAFLSEKALGRRNPDILVMTATPIPRTLSLTLYGDLDVSVLDQMPPGRGRIETKFYRTDQSAEVYDLLREKMRQGLQAYVVYPLVEESEKLDLKAAEKMYSHFVKNEFKDFKVGLIHGQMKRSDAETVMEDFKNKKVAMLIATTILEVGVDVPNANVMVIEHAERFGLSQLHQLRGRIGRGKEDGLCLLIGDPVSEDAQARVDAILSSNDGFKIAEQDLLIRGPGQYFGRHQHGLNELKFVNPITQIDILELARKEATELLHQDSNLNDGQNRVLKQEIQRRYPTYLEMVEAG